MAKLSAAKIAQVARTAGFPESSISTAVAVALAESSGDTRAHNTNRASGDNSYGLWQINMLGNLGPSRRRQFGITSNQQLFDPVTNARAALKISGGGTNWRPWAVYKSGAYRMYMGAAQSGSNARQAAEWDPGEWDWDGLWDGLRYFPFPPPEEGEEDWLRPFGGGGDDDTSIFSIATLIAGAAAWISKPENWIRVGYVVLGGALVIGGIAITARPYAQRAAKILPTGKALKAVKGKK